MEYTTPSAKLDIMRDSVCPSSAPKRRGFKGITEVVTGIQLSGWEASVVSVELWGEAED